MGDIVAVTEPKKGRDEDSRLVVGRYMERELRIRGILGNVPRTALFSTLTILPRGFVLRSWAM